MITDKSSRKIVMEVKRSDVKEADEGWSILGFSNPQPSGTRYMIMCENDLYIFHLVSLPCGMLFLCACVKGAFNLTDFLDLMFHIV